MPTYHGITFNTVLDAVTDCGMDPNGNNEISGELETYKGNNTLIEFPPGEYLFGRGSPCNLSGVDDFGLRGKGSSRSDVKLVPPVGYGDRNSTEHNISATNNDGFLIEDLTLDCREDKTTHQTHTLKMQDRLEIHNVEATGWIPREGETTAMLIKPHITTTNGVGNIVNFKSHAIGITDTDYPDRKPIMWTGPGHDGTLFLRNCNVQHSGSHGMYMSRHGGIVHVLGGLYKNNDNTNNRFSTGRQSGPNSPSRQVGVDIHLDFDNAPINYPGAYYQTGRGFRIESGVYDDWQMLTDDCDYKWDSKATQNNDALLVVNHNYGSATVQNSRFTMNVNGVPHIKIRELSDSPSDYGDTDVLIEDCHFTGTGDGPAVADYSGSDRVSTVRDCYVDLPNASNVFQGVDNVSNITYGTATSATISPWNDPEADQGAEDVGAPTSASASPLTAEAVPTGSVVAPSSLTSATATPHQVLSGTVEVEASLTAAQASPLLSTESPDYIVPPGQFGLVHFGTSTFAGGSQAGEPGGITAGVATPIASSGEGTIATTRTAATATPITSSETTSIPDTGSLTSASASPLQASVVTTTPGGDIVDDWEDQDFSEWAATDTSSLSDFTIVAHGDADMDGTYAAKQQATTNYEALYSHNGDGLDNYPAKGDVFKWKVKGESVTTNNAAGINFGVPDSAIDADNGYHVRYEFGDDDFLIQKRSTTTGNTVLASDTSATGGSAQAGDVFTIEVTWDDGTLGGSDNDITCKLMSADEQTTHSTLTTVNDSEFATDDGIVIRGYCTASDAEPLWGDIIIGSGTGTTEADDAGAVTTAAGGPLASTESSTLAEGGGLAVVVATPLTTAESPRDVGTFTSATATPVTAAELPTGQIEEGSTTTAGATPIRASASASFAFEDGSTTTAASSALTSTESIVGETATAYVTAASLSPLASPAETVLYIDPGSTTPSSAAILAAAEDTLPADAGDVTPAVASPLFATATGTEPGEEAGSLTAASASPVASPDEQLQALGGASVTAAVVSTLSSTEKTAPREQAGTTAALASPLFATATGRTAEVDAGALTRSTATPLTPAVTTVEAVARLDGTFDVTRTLSGAWSFTHTLGGVFDILRELTGRWDS